MMQYKGEDEKTRYIRTMASIWMIGGVLTAVLGFVNLFIGGILSTGGDPYSQSADFARSSGVFLICFGVVAVPIGYRLLKIKMDGLIFFEIQTGLGMLIFLFYSFSGGLFALEFMSINVIYLGASLGCLVLLIGAFLLRDQFRNT